jgi:hypothetical protein
MSCWSFGNSQKGYLYGADIEEQKRMLHEIIVNKCENSLLEFEKITNVKVEDYFLRGNNVQERKNQFTRILKKLETNQFYRTFNQDIQNQTLFQQLARIQHLGAIQNLQNLQNLQIYNKSYQDMKIIGNNPIIYCDIPYKGTGEYKEGGFNHDAFYDWFANLPYPAYLSEYDSPFEKIEMFRHRSSLSATNNKKQVFESIFWNGKGNIIKNTLF